jgi:hypothetical protein
MDTTKKISMMHQCQRTKDAVSKNKRKYLDFVVKSIDNKRIENAAASLLPFDNVISARLRFVDDSSLVKSMGFSVMRMEITPASYSLGISIEISEGEYNVSANPTIFLTAFQPLEQLREYVKGRDFAIQVTEVFDSQIDNIFYPRNN